MAPRGLQVIAPVLAFVIWSSGCCGGTGHHLGNDEEGDGAAMSPRPPAAALGEASRFGVDYVFPLMRESRSPALAKTLAGTGAGWVNFADVSWRRTEPRPPRGGRHRYRWDELDEAVRLWQGAGFRLVFSLRLGRGWFAGPVKHRPAVTNPVVEVLSRNADALPSSEHRASYRSWISALVERYDGDGASDMPGLRSPVRHFQVGNEYANPTFWSGTLDDYEALLRETEGAARSADPEARIISNGIRWNDLFHRDPEGELFEERFGSFLERLPSDAWRREWRRARSITEGTVRLAGTYDILDAGGNGPYPTASEGYMAWVRRELARSGASARIWDMEARCEPRLIADATVSFHPERRVPGGAALLRALRLRVHPRHDDAVAWYRAEQARILARVFVTRFAAGFEKVFMGMAFDWDRSAGALSTANPFIGLVNSEGRPWPAFHAFRMLVERLDGFTAFERVEGPDGVELFRVAFADGRSPRWVAWLDEVAVRGLDDALPRRSIRFDALSGPATVRRIPTIGSEVTSIELREAGPIELELTPTPVIIEPRVSGARARPGRRR